MKNRIVITTLVGLLAAAAGCADDEDSGNGNIDIVLEAEETIPEGIASCASSGGDECISDGYSASFSKYIISVGFIAMAQTDGTNPQSSSTVGVAEYTNLPTTLPTLTRFESIPTGQYNEFGYETPPPTSDVVNINGVDQTDIDAMIDNDWTYIIEGRLTRDTDNATLDFLIEADVPSVYSDCAVEGFVPGVNVSGPDSNPAAISMHGDHILFNGFPADESGVERLAEWMWLVDDTNQDGVLTRVDFEAATDVGTLYPSPPYSDINAGPAGTINNAWDFVRSQLGTQGHLDGEGECEWGAL